MTEQMSAKEYRDALAREGKKRSKYNAQRVEYDGHTFDSKRERDRYIELKTMEAAGVITDLELQQPFPLMVEDQQIGRWIADFVYWDNEEGERVYEDCKGYRTPLYRRTKKHVEAQYRIKIKET